MKTCVINPRACIQTFYDACNKSAVGILISFENNFPTDKR